MRNLLKINVLLFAILALVSCSEEGNQFTVTSQNRAYSHGENVLFKVVPNNGNKTPDSVKIVIDSKTELFVGETQCRFLIADLAMGKKSAAVYTYYKGKEEKIVRRFTVVSDIVPSVLQYAVVNTFPHDKKAYTQGLQFENGEFYESTGLYGESSLRYVDVKSGKILRKIDVDSAYFAEGLTIVGDTIFQLTWQEGKCLIYNKQTFDLLDSLTISTEGWGICYNGEHLIVSDGSEYLYFYNPVDFKLHHKIPVYDNRGAVKQLNELEFVEGFVYANIWHENRVIKINPRNGVVAAVLDFTQLQEKNSDADVLNGIAWNPQTDHFFVTGKLWKNLYEISISYKN